MLDSLLHLCVNVHDKKKLYSQIRPQKLNIDSHQPGFYVHHFVSSSIVIVTVLRAMTDNHHAVLNMCSTSHTDCPVRHSVATPRKASVPFSACVSSKRYREEGRNLT